MIIAIGGVSRAGKTTLARKIRDLFHPKSVTVLCQDDFVKPIQEIPSVNDRIDWEHPDSIDHHAFKVAIMAESEENEIVIAEGLMVFYDAETEALFDKKILIQIDFDTYLRRKKKDLRWGAEPDWYIKHIWESYLKYGNPIDDGSFMKLDCIKDYHLAAVSQYLMDKKQDT